MKYIVICFLLVLQFTALGQSEEVGPILINPTLAAKHPLPNAQKANAGTFDSTFIYFADTLVLPIFDDFSQNKFQIYDANYTDLGVTSDKKYRLLDLSDIPLTNDLLYTQQQTFRRTFDLANATFTDDNFTPESIQLGDLTSYPVSYTIIDAYPPYYIYDTLDYPNDPDTIWIPDAELFQDSATQFFYPLNDPGKYWLDDFAYHNYTMAKDPWTLGVATFDGLDQFGYPYAIGTTTSGFADYLTSKPIDLSGNLASDSIYLSFLFQAQGLCDAPEAGDSLHLEFYNKTLDLWEEVWRGGESTVTDFKVGHIKIVNPDYLSDAFQFRFKNYGGLSGSLDHYHLDYVHLRALSGYQDTLFKDFAFVYPINTLLKDYTSVPWDHYQNNSVGKMTDAAQIVVRNGSNIAENNSLNGSVEIAYGGTNEGSFVLVGPELANGDLNYGPQTTYYSYHDFSTGYLYDPLKPGIEQEWDILGIASAQFPNFTGNDSTYAKQVFKNYYSYDDGTAELAYGPTGIQSRLAIQYTPYEADSLIGALIHFVPTVYDVSNKLFLLTVWDDNNGEPGAVLYEDDVFFPRQPVVMPDQNLFAYYFLADTLKLPIDGTFYIGWRQFETERLNVGLDMNIVNNDKTFYSVDNGNTWNQSGFPGSVMIRPLFSTGLDVVLGVKETGKEIQTTLYPNPSSGKVNIETNGFEFTSVSVFDLQGKLLLKSDYPVVDLTVFNQGLYLFKIAGDPKTYKILKQ